jgi:hypothetical protein
MGNYAAGIAVLDNRDAIDLNGVHTLLGVIGNFSGLKLPLTSHRQTCLSVYERRRVRGAGKRLTTDAATPGGRATTGSNFALGEEERSVSVVMNECSEVICWTR